MQIRFSDAEIFSRISSHDVILTALLGLLNAEQKGAMDEFLSGAIEVFKSDAKRIDVSREDIEILVADLNRFRDALHPTED